MYAAKSNVERSCKSRGYEKGVNYDGIIFLFWKDNAALNWGGAAANMNNNFVWAAYDTVSYKVIRHEIGHNFGHDHHSRYHYLYRNTRPLVQDDKIYKAEKLDMVSEEKEGDLCFF